MSTNTTKQKKNNKRKKDTQLNKCKYPRCKNKEHDPLDIYCLDHSYPCQRCNSGGTIERDDIGDGLDCYCNDCYKLMKDRDDEKLQNFIELCQQKKQEAEARMRAYHNMYPNLLCARKQIEAGANQCVCYPAPKKVKTVK